MIRLNSVKNLINWTSLCARSRNYSSNPNPPVLPNLNQQDFTKIKISSEQSNDGLRRIVMNDMKTRNALSMKMMTELITAIDLNKSSELLRAITIESVEGPVYSAGHNLKEMTGDKGVEAQQAIFSKCSELMMSIRNSEVPVIGVVNGLAAAAGCQLISYCDFAISSTSSKFSTPGASFGLFCHTPGVGVSRIINRSSAAFMVLTGMPISAEEALRLGLVMKITPAAELENMVTEIYSHIKSKSRPVLKLGKEFFYQQLHHPLEQAMKEGEATVIKNLQYDDCQEGLQSFKEKRSPKWTHHQQS